MNPEDLDANVGAITLQWMQRMAAKFSNYPARKYLLFSMVVFGQIERLLFMQTEATITTTKDMVLACLMKKRSIKMEKSEFKKKVKDLMICPHDLL